MSDLVRRLRDPAFGTETSERNLMNQAADRIEQLEEASEMMLTDIRRTDVDMLAFKASIEQLEAALREIAGMDEVALIEYKKGDGWLHQRAARAALEGRT